MGCRYLAGIIYVLMVAYYDYNQSPQNSVSGLPIDTDSTEGATEFPVSHDQHSDHSSVRGDEREKHIGTNDQDNIPDQPKAEILMAARATSFSIDDAGTKYTKLDHTNYTELDHTNYTELDHTNARTKYPELGPTNDEAEDEYAELDRSTNDDYDDKDDADLAARRAYYNKYYDEHENTTDDDTYEPTNDTDSYDDKYYEDDTDDDDEEDGDDDEDDERQSLLPNSVSLPKATTLTEENTTDSIVEDRQNRPQCGFEDAYRLQHQKDMMESNGTLLFDPNYAPNFRAWSRSSLTYGLGASQHPVLSNASVLQVLSAALHEWGRYVQLTFRPARAYERPDIKLEFVQPQHPPCFPMSDAMLAHGFYPEVGQIHINLKYRWYIRQNRATSYEIPHHALAQDLYETVLHEVGHTLGLTHTSDFGSEVMSRFSSSPHRNFHLERRDVEAIRAIYMRREIPYGEFDPSSIPNTVINRNAIATTIRPIRKPPVINKTQRRSIMTYLCGNRWKRMDAAMVDTLSATRNYGELALFMFVGDLVYRLVYGKGLSIGYPKRIRNHWPHMDSGPIDAAVSIDRRTYLFKGFRFWRYTRTNDATLRYVLDYGYPREIRYGFPGIPNNVNAVETRTNEAGQVVFRFYKDRLVYEYKQQMAVLVHPHRNDVKVVPDAMVTFPTSPQTRMVFVGSRYYRQQGRQRVIQKSIHWDWFNCWPHDDGTANTAAVSKPVKPTRTSWRNVDLRNAASFGNPTTFRQQNTATFQQQNTANFQQQNTANFQQQNIATFQQQNTVKQQNTKTTSTTIQQQNTITTQQQDTNAATSTSDGNAENTINLRKETIIDDEKTPHELQHQRHQQQPQTTPMMDSEMVGTPTDDATSKMDPDNNDASSSTMKHLLSVTTTATIALLASA